MLETAAHKVKSHHLAREACLYVRQSSLKQVETNTESAHRQYGLRRSAIALGWCEDHIRVIDDDQGKSGASTANRSGFRDLMARIAAKEVGIVLSLEVSRLARNNHDWSQLLQVARIADTLILDEAGVHDPGDSSDKLLLDIKGTLSEYELEGIKARLIGGQRSKAARGELRIPLPIGLAYDEDGKVVLDGDRQIVEAIRLVFQAFRDKGSAMAVAKWFRAEGLRLPSRPQMGPARGELHWSLPDHARVRRVLKNPRYAGAFSYGRTTQRRQADGNRQHVTLRREQWQVCIPDLHAGFITWEEYCRNQETLERNAEAFASLESRRAAPREGAALLQSLMVCGRCGRRMSVHYSKAQPARNQPARVYYQCREPCVRRGERRCQSMRADTIDAALARFAVEAVNRENIALALAVQEQVRTEFEQADAQRALRIQRLEYEAGLAQRRYYAADPANRLVAAPLERDWNERLRELDEAVREREQRRAARDEELSARQVRRMEELAADFACVWDAAGTGNADRKRLLRLLVEDVTLTRDGYEVIVALRLRGGKALQLDPVDLPRPPSVKRPLCPATLALLDRTLDTHSDEEAAEVLNKAGFRHWSGEPYTLRRVYRLRARVGMPGHRERQQARWHEQGYLTAGAMASQLGIDVSTVRVWASRGKLLCERIRAGGKPRPMYKVPPRAAATDADAS